MRIQPVALLCAVLSTGLTSAPLAAPADKPPKIVPWSEIEQAIAGTICFAVVDGKTQDLPTFWDRKDCGSAAEPDSVASLVDSAIKDAAPIHVSILGYERERDAKCRAIPAGTQEDRNAAARKILLNDPSFVDPIVSRVIDALAARGQTCPDCPARAKVPSRSVTSKDVMPYALAFISVDPVHTVDAEGKPLEHPKLSFHICTGLNTVATLPRDERLARAGYVATSRAMDRDAVGGVFGNALGESAFGALADDAARTDYLRKRVAEQLSAGPDVKAAICTVAPDLRRDLALVVTDCPAK